MIVYVITTGYYNNVKAVVESKEEAEEIAKCYRTPYAGDDVEITECDTKRFITKDIAFVVDYDPIYHQWIVNIDDFYDQEYKGFERQNKKLGMDRYLVFAKSRDEAFKIGMDMNAEEKAKQNKFVF